MGGTRIVAFLGRQDRYKDRRYRLVSRDIETTSDSQIPHEIWIKLAADLNRSRRDELAHAGDEPAQPISLVVVGTIDTWSDFFTREELVRDMRRHLGGAANNLPIAFLQYDAWALAGGKEDQAERAFWDLFEGLRIVLSPKALAFSESLRHVQGDQSAFLLGPVNDVIVDVTHGYRATPFLASVVLNFVLTELRGERRRLFPSTGPDEAEEEGRRRELDPRYHILYAALDIAPEGDIVPVWDLTRFMFAARLADAIDAFVCYGRADDLWELGRQDGEARKSVIPYDQRTSEVLAPLQIARNFGVLARELADDLATIRLQSLFTVSAAKMKKFLDESSPALLERFPPLQPALNLLSSWVDPLVAPNTVGPEGLRATTYLAELYGKIERFAEQAVALREGLLTHYAHLTTSERPTEPGHPGFNEERKRLSESWNSAVIRQRTTSGRRDDPNALDPQLQNLELTDETTNVRNDIEHGGLNVAPKSASALRRALTKLTAGFRRLTRAS